MSDTVKSISTEYGDAKFVIYGIFSDGKTPERNDGISLFHNHSYYEIHFALSGSYSYCTDKKTVDLKGNEILIIPPLVSHKSVDIRNTDYSYRAMALSLEKIPGSEGFYDYFKGVLDSGALKPQAPLSLSARRLFEMSVINPGNSIKSYCAAKERAGHFIYELFNNLNGFKCDKQPEIPANVRQENLVLLDTLVSRFEPLGEIARRMNYSRRHTMRLIEQTYNKPLSELYRLYKKKGDELSE